MLLAARLVVAVAALYLVGLGVLALVRPARATRFLLGFAQTRRVHVAELAVRIVVGAALWRAAPTMAAPDVVRGFGVVLLVSSAGLALLPWQLHQRFAAEAVPRAARFVRWIGAASLAAGLLLGAALVRG